MWEAQEREELHRVQSERAEPSILILLNLTHMISTPAPGQVAMISSWAKQRMPVSERNLEIFLIENFVGWCGSIMLIRHCSRRPMIGWRKSGRKALGQPGT